MSVWDGWPGISTQHGLGALLSVAMSKSLLAHMCRELYVRGSQSVFRERALARDAKALCPVPLVTTL